MHALTGYADRWSVRQGDRYSLHGLKRRRT